MATGQDTRITELVTSAIADTKSLVKQQIELTKAELAQSAKHAASSTGMFVAAAILGFLAFIFLLVAGAYGIVAAGLPEWAGFLIVAGVLLLLTLILGLIGRSESRQVGPPERAKAALAETKAALTRTQQ